MKCILKFSFASNDLVSKTDRNVIVLSVTIISDPSQGLACAKKLMLSIRSWCNFVFSQALSRMRSQEDRENLVDDLFRRFEAGLVQDGRGNYDDIVNMQLVIRNIRE